MQGAHDDRKRLFVRPFFFSPSSAAVSAGWFPSLIMNLPFLRINPSFCDSSFHKFFLLERIHRNAYK